MSHSDTATPAIFGRFQMTNDEWARERAKAIACYPPTMLESTIETALKDAMDMRDKDWLARLDNPDEALVEAAHKAWMNRDLSDPDSEPLRDTIRALARTLTETDK